MQKIYDSPSFVVVHLVMNEDEMNIAMADRMIEMTGLLPSLEQFTQGIPEPKHAFEIIDKRTNREVLLTDAVAVAFQGQVFDWQDDEPTTEEVDSALEGYLQLATIPLTVH